MTLTPHFRDSSRVIAIVALLLGGSRDIALTQSPRLEYRVVFANARELGRRLDDAGQQGFSCAMVARPEPDTSVPGVVVVLSRPVGGAAAPVAHRVIKGGGPDLAPLLDRAGAENFRLCGVAVDEETPAPAIVAVMAQSPQAWKYGAEALTDYRGAISRLNAAGKEGFAPVAASPINNNRVPSLRSWVVFTERPAAGRSQVEVAVRSGSGPDRLQTSLVEQSAQGYRAAVAWKEGNDFVVMMTRATGGSPASVSYTVDTLTSAGIHGVSRPYIFDAPYLSDQRVVIAEKERLVSNEAVEDPLPPLGGLGYAASGPLGTMSDHLSRMHDYVVVSVAVRRGDRGVLVLRTVLTHQ
ncbi:MAG TPA: hypothetical protein VJN96_08215 [Vicinamibacterales bacterium]|nr:hypothetical protein [Vicinamibacterales bacterium]